MTVYELMRELDSMPRDAEVRLAFQPNYPLQYHVGEVVEYDPGEGYEIEFGTNEDPEATGWFVFNEKWLDDGGDGPAGPFATEQDAEKFIAKEIASDGDSNDGESIVYIGEAGQVYATPYLGSGACRAMGWR